MFNTLLLLHSLFRWLVLIGLVLAIYKSFQGYAQHKIFTRADNAIRHWTATLAHIQLLIGIFLYTQSDTVQYYFTVSDADEGISAPFFFGIIHIMMMLGAIAVLTVGSAKAKRKPTDAEKFRTILIWYSLALLIIFLAIPWPFSPLAQRPYFRTF